MSHYPVDPNSEKKDIGFQIKQELILNDQLPLFKLCEKTWFDEGAKKETKSIKREIDQQRFSEELYSGHAVKEELVIGPEVLQSPGATAPLKGLFTCASTRILEPSLQDIEKAKQDKLHKEITDHKITKTDMVNSGGLISECKNEELKMTPVKTERKENLEENTNLQFNNLPLDIVQDSNIAKSFDLLEEKPTNPKLNQESHFGCSESNMHFNPHDTIRKQFECDSCSLKFSNKLNLSKHIKLCHSNAIPITQYFHDTYKFKDTNKSVLQTQVIVYSKENQSIKLKQPLKMNTEKKKYTCTYCKYSSSRSNLLKVHLRTHTGDKPFSCTYCNYSCSQNSRLKVHLRTHTKEKPFRCTYCEYSCVQSSRLKIHLRMHTGEKPYSCTYCNYTCSTSDNLKLHLRTHTGEKTYTCSYCEFSCSASSYLKIHLRKHTGEKPYNCTYCSYSCSRNSSLIVHLRTHTGEKPYSCTYCVYTCSTNSSLKKHLRTHTGDKPYICTHCSYSCCTSSNLREHLRTHTGEKPFSCTHCNYICNKSSRLKAHLRIHSEQKRQSSAYFIHY